MTDDADTIARKLRRAKTDPDPLPETPAGLEERPEARNLLGIYAALSDKSMEDACAEFAGAQFSRFKESITELGVSVLAPIGDEMSRLTADPAYLDQVLARGAAEAFDIAKPVLNDVYDIVGLLRPTP